MNSDTIQLGAFDVGSLLGKGGMARVYAGEHRATGLPVAVKVIRREADQDVRKRFHEEVQAHAGLLHPGIVYLFEYGTIGAETQRSSDGDLQAGEPYVAMELAECGTLRDALPVESWEVAHDILGQVLGALAHAHARGVIHRDLKPENLLVFEPDNSGGGQRVKLADFGIAHAFGVERGQQTDRLESSAGTPHYMAPEQLRGRWRNYGPWTDLYALGCTAWELVCGRPPFSGDSVWAIAMNQMTEARPPLDPQFQVPEELQRWIHRAMAVDPRARFRHAADAARALPARLERTGARQVGVEDKDSESVATLSTGLTIEQKHGCSKTVDESPPARSLEPVDELAPTQSLGPGEAPAPCVGGRKDLPAKVGTEYSDELAFRPPIPDAWRREEITRRPEPLLGAGLGLFGLREPPFVNRRDECETIWNALRRVVQQRTIEAIFITGEAGTGKSRLANYVATRADELGVARIIRAIHTSEGTRQPGIRGALERTLRTVKLQRDEVFTFLTERLPRLPGDDSLFDHDARALTEFLRPTREGADEVRGPRFSFTDSAQQQNLVLRTLRRLTQQRPLFLWLDDLQWGQGTLRILEWLADASTETSPALIVATVRSDVVIESPQIRERLRSIRDAFDGSQLKLSPLDWDHQRDLLQRLLPLAPDFADRLTDRTEGHPLFAMQLLAHWIDQDAVELKSQGYDLQGDTDVSLPEDIHQLWIERIRRLLADPGEPNAEDERAALELAAALGREVDAREWRAVIDEAGLVVPRDLLDRLVERRLAERTPDGWSFAHGLLVDSLETMARRAGRWEQQHRRCARGLARVADSASFGTHGRVANHWLKGGHPERALQPLLEEIRLASRRGFDQETRRHLERREEILTALDLPSDHARRIEQTAAEAELEWWLGHVERARQLLDEAWHAVDDSAPRLMGNLASVRARIETSVSRLEEGRYWAHQALEYGDEESRCTAYRTLAWLAFFDGNMDDALDSVERASELVEEVGEVRAALDTKRIRAVILDARGDDGAEALLHEICRRSEQVGIQKIHAQALNALGGILDRRGCIDEALEHFERYLQVAREMNDPSHRANALLNLAGVYLADEQSERAGEYLRRRRALLEEYDDEHDHIHGRVTWLAWAAAEGDRRRFDEHWSVIQDAWRDDWKLQSSTAQIFERAANFARRAGWKDSAVDILNLTRAMWYRMGDAEAVERLDRRLAETGNS